METGCGAARPRPGCPGEGQVVVAVQDAVLDVDAGRPGSTAGLVCGVRGTVVDCQGDGNGVRPGDVVAAFGPVTDRAVCRRGSLFVLSGDDLPGGVPESEAALLPLAALALHVADLLAPLEGSVAVHGLSAVGLLAALGMRRAGDGPVSAVDGREARRRLGTAFGTAPVWASLPLGEEWSRAVDATGDPEAIVRLLDAMAPMGRIALVGPSRGRTVSADLYSTVHRRGLLVIGIPAPPSVTMALDRETMRRAASLVAEACARPGFVSNAVAAADVPQWDGDEPLLRVCFE